MPRNVCPIKLPAPKIKAIVKTQLCRDHSKPQIEKLYQATLIDA